MESEREKLQRKLRSYRDLLRQFPDGPTNGTIRHPIAELEQELHALQK